MEPGNDLALSFNNIEAPKSDRVEKPRPPVGIAIRENRAAFAKNAKLYFRAGYYL